MIISFAWTTPALVMGYKTVTRRDWSPSHAAKFKAGMVLDAWNYSPRVVSRNPHKVATIRLTCDPYLELSSVIPDKDWYAEGFEYAMEHELRFERKTTAREVWDFWKANPHYQWVVRFEVVEVVEPCFYCGQGCEAGHELVVDQWQGGEDWSLHEYAPELMGSPWAYPEPASRVRGPKLVAAEQARLSL